MKNSAPASSGTLRRFAEVCDGVGATTKKKEKVRLISELIRGLSHQEAALAAIFLTGRPFAGWEERVLGIGGSQLFEVIASLSGADAKELSSTYRKYGDAGDAAADLLRANSHNSGLSISDLAKEFDALAAARTRAAKAELLAALFGKASAEEIKYIVKIITGDLRIGSRESLVEEAIAQAFEQPLEAVRRANMLLGDIGATLALARKNKLASASVRLLHPLGLMLATPVEQAAELADELRHGLVAEEKYDGIRAQIHKSGARIKMFSRTLDELTEFPELAAPLLALPGELILDGEILAWGDFGPLPFTELQQRLGRKTSQPSLFDSQSVPVRFVAFDVLYRDGELLLDLPLQERRRQLETIFDTPHSLSLQLAPVTACGSVESVEQAFHAALAAGHEGIVLKKLDSPYAAGRRGRQWFKLKQPLATLDVVVTAVEYGHGRRHHVLSDYTFAVRSGDKLLNVGKAYSGLSDAEIAEYTEYFKQHAVRDEGWRLIVEPNVVIEVAFNNMQRSDRHDSGYALRFPRIVRLRPDKPVEEIDDLARVKALFDAQFKTGTISTESPGAGIAQRKDNPLRAR
jgi:DNA ligase 1